MTLPWFRFYSEALHDPKVQTLPPATFKAWINLLCLASEASDRGSLPGEKEISYGIRLEIGKTRKLIATLVEAQLIDAPTTSGDPFRIHNWPERQPKSDDAAARMANKRRTSSEQTPNKFVLDTEVDKRENRTDSEEDSPPVVPLAGGPAHAKAKPHRVYGERSKAANGTAHGTHAERINAEWEHEERVRQVERELTAPDT